VIVDDGSTDESLRRIRRYLGDCGNRLYSKERNEGYTGTQAVFEELHDNARALPFGRDYICIVKALPSFHGLR
jgi:hypothetical protein